MKLDLSKTLERKKAKVYFDKLLLQNKKIELKVVQPNRSISQNSYLHVVISLYAINFGYTLNEAKTDLKRLCEFLVYEKNGTKYLKETSKMNSKELSEFINWIRNYASLNGLYIPTAEEYKEHKFSIDKEINNHKTYL